MAPLRRIGAARRGKGFRRLGDVDISLNVTSENLVTLEIEGDKSKQVYSMNLPTWLILTPLFRERGHSWAVCYEHAAAVLDGEFSNRAVQVDKVNEIQGYQCHCGEPAFFQFSEIRGIVQGREPIEWLRAWQDSDDSAE